MNHLSHKRKNINHIFIVAILLLLPLVISSCGGGGGGGGGAATSPTVPGTDTTPPTISVTFPTEGSEFIFPAQTVSPAYISASYSDAQSGIDVSYLAASYTMNGRTISLTDLFAKDTVANAASSRTSASNIEPLVRTTVSLFSSGATQFTAPESSATVGRAGNGRLSMSCVEGTGKAYLWNPSDTIINAITQSDGLAASQINLTYTPTVFESASDRNRFYAARSGYNKLFIYNSTTAQLVSTINLADEPANFAYHPGTGKLYISYKTNLNISRLDVATDLLDAYTVGVGSIPALLTTRRGENTGGVFAVWPSGGRYRLFEYDASGAAVRNVALDLLQPSDIEFVTAGYIYLSNFGSDTLTRIKLTDNSTVSIGVGSLPRKMIVSGSDAVYVINSGPRTLSLVRGTTVEGTYQTQPLPLDGNAGCFSGKIAVVEDIWSISTRTAGTISASIRDRSGNTATAARTIYIRPEAIGP